MSNRTCQENKRGDIEKRNQSGSPETPDRGKTSELPGLGTNQPTKQGTNQARYQSTKQGTNQPTNQPRYPPTNQARYQPTNQSINTQEALDVHPVDSGVLVGEPALATNQPTNQSTKVPTNQPSKVPTKQGTNQPSNQSTHKKHLTFTQWTMESWWASRPWLPTNQPTNQPRYPPTNQARYLPTKVPTKQALKQATNQSINTQEALAAHPVDSGVLVGVPALGGGCGCDLGVAGARGRGEGALEDRGVLWADPLGWAAPERPLALVERASWVGGRRGPGETYLGW